MAQVNILDSVTVHGADCLAAARKEVRKFRKLNCKVPARKIRGGWKVAGFSLDFEEAEDAFPPLGNLYLEAGEKKAKAGPTETSELEIFFVHSGEGITNSNPLATGDLFGTEPEPNEALVPPPNVPPS